MPTDDKTYYSALTDPPAPPTTDEEIYVRDASGKLKVLRDGELVDAEPAVSGKVPSPLKPGAPPQSLSPLKPGGSERGVLSAAQLPVTSHQTPGYDVEAQVDQVIKQAGLTLPSAELQSRLHSVIRSRLKNARSSIQTKETLTRVPTEGGLGLPAIQADKIMEAANRAVSSLEDKSRPVPPPLSDLQKEAEMLLPRPAVQPPVRLASLPPSLPQKEISPLKPGGSERGVQSLTPLPPRPAPVKSDASSFKFQVSSPRPAVQQPAPSSVSASSASTLPTTNYQLPTNFKPKLTGPLEELRGLTLMDFRRLGPNPAACVDKVQEKIGLLDVESFAKKIEGTRAWKSSEVNRLYIEMGDQSLQKGMAVKDIIAQRQAARLPCLSVDEFEAVMDLNKRLRA